MPSRRLALAFALSSFLLACTAVAPPAEAPRRSTVPPAVPQPTHLSQFVGTWQAGEPCTNHYRWLQLREGEGVVEGRWAASMDIWGLMTGGIRATPSGTELLTESCLETYDLPRYAAYFAGCPKYAPVEDQRGLRLDESTGELLLMSSRDGGVISRMKKVDAAPEPPAVCNVVEG